MIAIDTQNPCRAKNIQPMPEFSVRVVRSAFREMRKLPPQYSQEVYKIIKNFWNGDSGDHRKLEGYKDLWRTRKNDVRVIWTKIETNTWLIIKAGQRRDVYRGILEDRNRSNHFNLSHLLGIEEEKINNIPTYEWTDSNRNSWTDFVNGGYLYSPVLTEEQRKVFAELKVQSPIIIPGKNYISSLLIQSSPGTGKTVCAALIACDLYKTYGWSINLVLPQALCKEVKEFDNIKNILQEQHNSFFIGTLEEWFKTLAPDRYAQVASLSEELTALAAEARRVHIVPFSEQDLRLYRGFVYNSSTNKSDSDRHPIYRDNQQRISQLTRITDRWKENLNGRMPWIDGLKQLTEQLLPQHSTERQTSIFIFDEAQDYLLDELNFVVQMLNRWQQDHNHSAILCLLGDMNQRIQPVNFDWGDLHLNKRHTLKYNYRNTKKILEFANIFHTLARKINSGNRNLPESCNPEDAFENGEPVRILKISSSDEAVSFLTKLSQRIRFLNNLSERYLLSKLSSQVSLIHASIPENCRNLNGINYLSIQQAKGREFDACIAFCVFEGEGMPSFQESNNWYTIFTRPRHRLLIIATYSEIARIGQDYFENCDSFDISNTEPLINWISELCNSEDLCRDIDAISNLIYEGLNTEIPQIYWDTYAALRLTRIDVQRITEIETEIIEKLSKKSHDILQTELTELSQTEAISSISIIDRVPLICLLLRSLGRSWQAVDEASTIQSLSPQEHNRLISAIANELEAKGLFYEAARVKAKLKISFPRDYPFSDSFDGTTGSLVSILCNSAINRIS